jgi:Mrp family chromosome partitioning ATPase
MMGVEDQEVHRSGAGWSPVYAEAPSEEEESIAVMSVGFMLTSKSDAIIWRGPRKNGLIKQFLTEVDWGHLDVLLIDAPPGTSDEHISIANLLKEAHPDGAVIVTTPQEVALLDVRKEITFCRKVGLNVLGVVENMAGFACPCCDTISDIFGSGEKKVQMMCEEMKTSLLGSLPLDPNILKCCEQGIGYVSKFKDAPGSRAFSAMVESLMTSTEPLKKTWDEVNSV